MCDKTKDSPATCALCGKDHPANYRGCTVHKELQKSRNKLVTTSSRAEVCRGPVNNSQPVVIEQHILREKTTGMSPSNATSSRSYLDTVKLPNLPNSQTHESSPSEPPLAPPFTSFLEHFQSLVTPLINLFITLINKIASKNDN